MTDADANTGPTHEELWLARTTEEPLDPQRPIIDPHHHLWDRGLVSGRYLSEELNADTSTHNVVKTVFVECKAEYRTDGPEHLQPVGETEFVVASGAASVAAGGVEIAGIVSHADLTLGDAVEEVLAAHEAAGAGRFRGIRHASNFDAADELHNSHHNAGPHLLADPNFREGFTKLGAMGYSFDAWLYSPQLPQLIDLVQAHPDTPVVLDHIGAPVAVGPYAAKRPEILEAWRADLAELAKHPQVTVKVGGIGMNRYLGGGWPGLDAPPSSQTLADYWAPELRYVIDTFGPARSMFESNFPVDRESGTYVVLWNTFKRVAEPYSEAEKTELFHDAAARAYRL
jgi:predicted TIM-barrel fold metal-dependent hydrolase